MSIDPLTLTEKIEDPKIREILEKWRDQINPLITSYNNGANNNLNTSGSYDLVVTDGRITGVS